MGELQDRTASMFRVTHHHPRTAVSESHFDATANSAPLSGGRRNPIVGKKFPVECHHDTIPGRMRFLLQVDTEVDRAHDPVAELLMDELLDCPAVHLQSLVETVDGRVNRHS